MQHAKFIALLSVSRISLIQAFYFLTILMLLGGESSEQDSSLGEGSGGCANQVYEGHIMAKDRTALRAYGGESYDRCLV